jgi:hypothetical protein
MSLLVPTAADNPFDREDGVTNGLPFTVFGETDFLKAETSAMLTPPWLLMLVVVSL